MPVFKGRLTHTVNALLLPADAARRMFMERTVCSDMQII
jgi:hypothetical protein